MLTRAGWGLLVASAAVLVAARAFGLLELQLMGATGLLLLVGAGLLVRFRTPTLQVDRQVQPDQVHLGGHSRVELHVVNAARRASPIVALHEPIEGTVGAQVSIPPLAPDEEQTATYRLPANRRGRLHVGPLRLRRADPFGLVATDREIAGTATLTVLPAIEPLTSIAAGGGLDDPLAGQTHAMLGLSGDEDFSSLRDYVVGDDLRRVHWASSARNGDLLVRQDDPPWRGHVTVVLDTRADRIPSSRFEDAVSATASIVHEVSRHGDRARLILTGGTDTGLLDARAERDLLMEHLALVGQQEAGRDGAGAIGDLTPVRRGHPGGLVVVTGTPDDADHRAFASVGDRYSLVRVVCFLRDQQPGVHVPGVEVMAVAPGASFGAAWRAQP